MARAAVALGSNLGDRLGFLRSGLEGIRRLGEVVAVSSLYETDPVGGPEQGRYLNAMVLVETDLTPSEMLAALHHLEGDADRIRSERWGPRTLDLDLIVYDELRLHTDEIQLPHPRAHERRFVLAPLSDVAPEAVLADGRTALDALQGTRDQRILEWAGDWEHEMPRLGTEVPWWLAGQVVLGAGWILVTALTADPNLSVSSATGLALALAGVALGVSAVRAFGAEVTPSPQPRDDQELIVDGAYRLVRHPMYGAVVLGVVGVALAVGSLAGVGVGLLVAVFFWGKSTREERALAVGLPEYSRYADRVRRRLLPWVV